MPTNETTTTFFRSSIGLEKRELSVHAATVYQSLSPFLTALPPLLCSALLPYVREALEQGFLALTAKEGQVYERWCKDRTGHKVCSERKEM